MTNLQKLIKEIQSLPSCQFVSFEYTSKGTNETARHNIALRFNYSKMLQRDLAKVEAMPRQDGIKEDARQDILARLKHSLDCMANNVTNENYTCKDAFITLGNGLKLHVESGLLHINGIAIKKTILKEGVYKERNKRALTIAKDEIEKQLAKSKIRQFVLDANNLQIAKINGSTIELAEVK